MNEMEVPDRLAPKIKAISNTFRRLANSYTAELGITGAQSFLLGYLSRHQDGYPCQHDIEVRFNIKHPTATGILKRLAEKGFVEFKTDDYDKRLKRIAITESGLNVAHQTRLQHLDIESRLTSNFSEEELTELHRLLDKLVANAKAQRNDIAQEGEN